MPSQSSEIMVLILEAPEFTSYDIEMTISISRALLNRILADAAKDSGAERCGLLLGEAARICDVRFAANVAPEPACHFELDPAVLLDAHRTARNGGSRVVGHYHSHPSGKAVPSSIDAECAAPDGSLWLIVADAQARLWRAVAKGDRKSTRLTY